MSLASGSFVIFLLLATSATPPGPTATVAAPSTSKAPMPSGADLAQRAQELEKLRLEIEERQRLHWKRPWRKFITGSTKEPEWAGYAKTFHSRLLDVGNRDFPTEVERLGLAGKVILTASINRDGSLRGCVINLSSGQQILDEAACDTVRNAAPFAPLPKNGEDIDILDITTTLRYVHDGGKPPLNTH